MAILTHPNHGERALRFCTQPPESKKPNITPMRLLVKHMPGLFVGCIHMPMHTDTHMAHTQTHQSYFDVCLCIIHTRSKNAFAD